MTCRQLLEIAIPKLQMLKSATERFGQGADSRRSTPPSWDPSHRKISRPGGEYSPASVDRVNDRRRASM